MIKNLTKHGNSLAFIIDKPILELIGASADTPFEVTTDGEALIFSPVKNPNDKKNFTDALSMTNKRYGRALRKLGK